MIYAIISSEEARKRLNEAIEEARDVKWYIRLRVISFSATRKTVAELSQMFELCEATIRSYIHAYNQGGLKQLAYQAEDSLHGKNLYCSLDYHFLLSDGS